MLCAHVSCLGTADYGLSMEDGAASLPRDLQPEGLGESIDAELSQLSRAQKLSPEVLKAVAVRSKKSEHKLGEGLSVSKSTASARVSVFTATGPTQLVSEALGILCHGWKRRGHCDHDFVKLHCAAVCKSKKRRSSGLTRKQKKTAKKPQAKANEKGQTAQAAEKKANEKGQKAQATEQMQAMTMKVTHAGTTTAKGTRPFIERGAIEANSRWWSRRSGVLRMGKALYIKLPYE